MQKCYSVLPNGNRGLSENCTHAENKNYLLASGGGFFDHYYSFLSPVQYYTESNACSQTARCVLHYLHTTNQTEELFQLQSSIISRPLILLALS